MFHRYWFRGPGGSVAYMACGLYFSGVWTYITSLVDGGKHMVSHFHGRIVRTS